MSQVDAIDISQWQGVINWNAVPQPIAIIKMSGGDAGLYTDSKANANYYGAKSSGKALGMYHFAGGINASNEADFFVAACSPLEQDDVLVLDFEIPHNNPVGWCNTFVTRVHDRTGVWPLLYINLATLNAHDWSPVLVNCGLWLAAWNNDPNATLTDKVYVMHQYSSNGSVPGIAGRVDLDAWFGTLAQFKKYGYQVAAPVPEPTTTTTLPPPPVTTTTTLPPEPSTTSTTTTTTLPPNQPPASGDNSNWKLLVGAIIGAIAALVAAIIHWLQS